MEDNLKLEQWERTWSLSFGCLPLLRLNNLLKVAQSRRKWEVGVNYKPRGSSSSPGRHFDMSQLSSPSKVSSVKTIHYWRMTQIWGSTKVELYMKMLLRFNKARQADARISGNIWNTRKLQWSLTEQWTGVWSAVIDVMWSHAGCEIHWAQ